MPQLDKFSFFIQIFWVFLVICVLYYVFFNYILPLVSSTIKYRVKNIYYLQKGFKIGIFLFIVCYITLLGSMICFYDLISFFFFDSVFVAFDNSYYAMSFFIFKKPDFVHNIGLSINKHKVLMFLHDAQGNVTTIGSGSLANKALYFCSKLTSNTDKFHFTTYSSCETNGYDIPNHFISSFGIGISHGSYIKEIGLANLQVPVRALRTMAEKKSLHLMEKYVFKEKKVYSEDNLFFNANLKKLSNLSLIVDSIIDEPSSSSDVNFPFFDFTRTIEEKARIKLKKLEQMALELENSPVISYKDKISLFKPVGSGTIVDYTDKKSSLHLNVNFSVTVISKDNEQIVSVFDKHVDFKQKVSRDTLGNLNYERDVYKKFVSTDVGNFVFKDLQSAVHIRFFVLDKDYQDKKFLMNLIRDISESNAASYAYEKLPVLTDGVSRPDLVIDNRLYLLNGGRSKFFCIPDSFCEYNVTNPTAYPHSIDIGVLLNFFDNVKLP